MSNIDKFNDYFSNKKSNINENNTIQSNVQTSYDYEWVDINTVWEYREFDRSKESENRADSNRVINELSDKLQSGFREPLIMQYSHKYKTAYLIEGNHRLLVAKRLGYKYVPVRVTIDGTQVRDAKKVVGYYASINDKVQPSLPSEIGIPNCFDKNFKPVDSEDVSFEEEKEIDFSKLPDAKQYTRESYGMKTNVIEFKPLKYYWNVGFLFDSEDFDYMDEVLDNRNTLHSQYGSSIWQYLDYGDSYFTDEMKKKVDLVYPEQQYPESYSDIYDEYYDEVFQETEEFELYEKEIARVLWEKMRKEALEVINFGHFNSESFGGSVRWLNGKMSQNSTFDKETYKKIMLETYSFSYDGVVFENEDIKSYEFDGNEETYEEILRKNYDYQTNMDMDFKEVEDYRVDISELKIENIFK